jgi:hypothetical protein
MKSNVILIAILALVIGGAAGAYGGIQYQKSQRLSFGGSAGFAARAGGAGAAGGVRGRNGNGAVGTILSVDSNSITVKMNDGSSKIVLLTGTTAINKAATAAVSDLTTGETVSAFGTTNTDGSITATNVQINPLMRGPGGPSGTPGASNSANPPAGN